MRGAAGLIVLWLDDDVARVGMTPEAAWPCGEGRFVCRGAL